MSSQISLEKQEAYCEILEIFKFMDKRYVEKIPKKLIELFRKNSAPNYIFHINTNIPFEEQNLKRETLVILAMLNLNYWCSSEHKQELLQLYNQNEELYQAKLRENYNLDNIFKNKNSHTNTTEIAESTAMIEVKEKTLLQKLFDKIKKFFRK